MSFAQLRAHWIASEHRQALVGKLSSTLGEVLAKAVPQVPESVVKLAVQAALTAVDEVVAAPVQVDAAEIHFRDHR